MCIRQRWSVSRKVKKEAKVYFDGGELVNSQNYSYKQLLFLQPIQNVEVWQKILKDDFVFVPSHWSEYDLPKAPDKFYEHLQQAFLGYISNFHFHPQDRAWIFTQIFGDTYDADRKFPLILPNESQNRLISKTAQEIADGLMVDIYNALEEDEEGRLSYTLYLSDYLFSLVPVLSESVVFDMESTESSNNMVVITLNYVIDYAQKKPIENKESDRSKIKLAKFIKNIFDYYQDSLKGYDHLVKLVEKEGPQL